MYTQELMHTYVQDPDNTETAGKGNQALGQRNGGGRGAGGPSLADLPGPFGVPVCFLLKYS